MSTETGPPRFREQHHFPTEQETANAILHHVPPAASELNPAVSQVTLADLRLEMALGLIIALLVIRPSGLLGRRHVRRV